MDTTVTGPASSTQRSTIIDARKPMHRLSPRELWGYRDLLILMILRDIKLRYRQTFLGIVWAVLQPLLPMVVFTLLFGRLAHIPADGLPYPLFVYAGLLPWTFFNNTVSTATTSLVSSTALVTKVYFPRVLLPASCVIGGLLDLGISGLIFVVLAVNYHLHPTWNLMLLPVPAVLVALVAFAFSAWLSVWNVYYRDVRYAVPFLLQVWMYVTPVIYPVTFIPERMRWLLDLNPLSGIVTGFRSALFGQPFRWSSVLVSATITTLLLVYAIRAFHQMERQVADFI
jgi:lipopolysaccharide transport system permease protein